MAMAAEMNCHLLKLTVLRPMATAVKHAPMPLLKVRLRIALLLLCMPVMHELEAS